MFDNVLVTDDMLVAAETRIATTNPRKVANVSSTSPTANAVISCLTAPKARATGS